MKNWFKSVDPDSFAKTQTWYVKQIDDYINRLTPRKKKTLYGHNRKEILKKIEKGFQVNELELKHVAKTNAGILGATSLYNSYLMKILCQFSDPFIQKKYDQFNRKQRSKSGETDVYSRMKKDAKRRETIYLKNSNILSPPGSVNISRFQSIKTITSLTTQS